SDNDEFIAKFLLQSVKLRNGFSARDAPGFPESNQGGFALKGRFFAEPFLDLQSRSRFTQQRLVGDGIGQALVGGPGRLLFCEREFLGLCDQVGSKVAQVRGVIQRLLSFSLGGSLGIIMKAFPKTFIHVLKFYVQDSLAMSEIEIRRVGPDYSDIA